MAYQNGDRKSRNGFDKKHPFVKLKRKARLTYLKILRIDDPPERIARGVAIGVAVGVLPSFGLGFIFALAAAFVLRANKAASILGTFIMNPITSPFFWTGSLVVGSALTGDDFSTIYRQINENGWVTGASRATLDFLIGNVVVTIVTTAVSYYVAKHWIIRHRRRKEEKRLKKQAGIL